MKSWLAFAGICAAILAFVIFMPQGARAYLLDFAFSCAVIFVALVLTWPVDRVLRRMPPAVAIPAIAAGYFLLISAFHFLGGAIEQRRPAFPLGHWLTFVTGREWWTRRWGEAFSLGVEFAIVMAVLMTVDALLQRRDSAGPTDLAYYPRVGGLVKSLSLVQGRLVLILGFLFFLGVNADLAVQEFADGRLAGPEVALYTCVMGWNVLWIADCLSRPRYTTLWVAVAFFVNAVIALPPGMFARE
jgi:hypothetical protein